MTEERTTTPTADLADSLSAVFRDVRRVIVDWRDNPDRSSLRTVLDVGAIVAVFEDLFHLDSESPGDQAAAATEGQTFSRTGAPWHFTEPESATQATTTASSKPVHPTQGAHDGFWALCDREDMGTCLDIVTITTIDDRTARVIAEIKPDMYSGTWNVKCLRRPTAGELNETIPRIDERSRRARREADATVERVKLLRQAAADAWVARR